MNSNSILIIAGELSGDVQGGKLVKAIKNISPDIQIGGIGGDNMKAAGMTLSHHVSEMSFLGFSEVIKHIPFIRRVMHETTDWIKINRPKAVVLIDYPGFNLRLAKKANRLGCKVIYYISPQIWAWGKKRIKHIARYVDHMIVVFPFEKEIYEKAGVTVDFVGHPILEELNAMHTKEDFFKLYDLNIEKPLIGLLPGSREQEVQRLYGKMLEAFDIMSLGNKDLQSITAVTPTLSENLYNSIERESDPKHSDLTYDIMKHSDLLFVASGTATLESACFGTPLIVVYKVSPISWILGKMLVKIKSIGLVNIVAGEQIVPEILQSDLTGDRLAKEGFKILQNEKIYSEISSRLLNVRNKLGESGASERAAKLILKIISK